MTGQRLVQAGLGFRQAFATASAGTGGHAQTLDTAYAILGDRLFDAPLIHGMANTDIHEAYNTPNANRCQ